MLISLEGKGDAMAFTFVKTLGSAAVLKEARGMTNPDTALHILYDAARFNPRDVDILEEIVSLHLQKKEYEKAENMAKKALTIFSRPGIQKLLIDSLLAQGKKEEADKRALKCAYC